MGIYGFFGPVGGAFSFEGNFPNQSVLGSQVNKAKDQVTNMLRSSQVNPEMTQVIQGQSNVIQRRGYVIQQKSYVNKEHMNLLRIHSTCQVDQSQELGPRNSMK